MHKEAKVFFRELLESFPKSELAKKAKKLLSSSPTAVATLLPLRADTAVATSSSTAGSSADSASSTDKSN